MLLQPKLVSIQRSLIAHRISNDDNKTIPQVPRSMCAVLTKVQLAQDNMSDFMEKETLL